MLDIQVISSILLFVATGVLLVRLWRLAPDGSRMEVVWGMMSALAGLVLLAAPGMRPGAVYSVLAYLGLCLFLTLWASVYWPRRWRREAAAGPTHAAATRVAPAAAPAGWYPDPGHRHEWRYFNGATWTAQVADAGRVRVDPVPAGAGSSGATPDDPAESISPGSSGG